MKHYYQERFHWIFHYTQKTFGYCLLKTLCILVGLPIYLVCFAMEMALVFINMIFGWIPVLGVLVTVLCKILMIAVSFPYYICVLTDLSAYREAMKEEPDYDVDDAPQEVEWTTQDAEPNDFAHSVDCAAEDSDGTFNDDFAE